MKDLMNTITLCLKSQETFPVNFDDFWQWCGFARKDSAKRTLERNFSQSIDYQVFHPDVENSKGGRPTNTIHLSIDCAKSFAMLAQTEKGKEVRLYFLECEKRLQALTKSKNKLQVLKESVETLIDHEERITDLEQERADAKAYLAAINKDPSEALYRLAVSTICRYPAGFRSYYQIVLNVERYSAPGSICYFLPSVLGTL